MNIHYPQHIEDEIKKICGLCFIRIATPAEDTQQATDFKWYEIDGGLSLGCRIRTNRILTVWPTQFTIRTKSMNGGRTEIHKILEGKGSHLLYGFESLDRKSIEKWTIIDLNIFREFHKTDKLGPSEHVPNHDGTAGMAWDLINCPEIIFKSSYPIDELNSPFYSLFSSRFGT